MISTWECRNSEFISRGHTEGIKPQRGRAGAREGGRKRRGREGGREGMERLEGKRE